MNIASPSMHIYAACLLLACCVAFPSAAGEVVLVDYDDATAKVHGDFPSRSRMAEILTALHRAGAKAVVLKFFLDGPGNEPDNHALAEAISRGRTILQATVNPEPPTTRLLAARFYFADTVPFTPTIRGDAGWLPLPMFADKATRICFADVRALERLPMLEQFGGKPVASLYACVLAELHGVGQPAFTDKSVQFGKQVLPMNAEGEVLVNLSTLRPGTRIPALHLFAGKGWQDAVRGRVAVVMYTGPTSPTTTLNGRVMKVHDVFAAQIMALQALTSR